MKAIVTIGLDIAKQVFQVHGADKTGRPVLRRKLRRSEVIRFFSEQPSSLVGIEASGSAHYLGESSGWAGAHCPVDGATVRKALRQVAEE